MDHFEWDEVKNRLNLEKYGLDFVAARELFNNPMLIVEDDRQEYREKRYIGMGYVKQRVMVIVYTQRPLNIIRIISFRRDNKREQSKFKKALEKNKF